MLCCHLSVLLCCVVISVFFKRMIITISVLFNLSSQLSEVKRGQRESNMGCDTRVTRGAKNSLEFVVRLRIITGHSSILTRSYALNKYRARMTKTFRITTLPTPFKNLTQYYFPSFENKFQNIHLVCHLD